MGAGLRREREMVDTLQEETECGVSFQNFQAKKEEQMSSGFKHDLLSFTLLIIFGFHAKESAFSKFLHHKNVKSCGSHVSWSLQLVHSWTFLRVDVSIKIFYKATINYKLDETAQTITIQINNTTSLSHKKNYTKKRWDNMKTLKIFGVNLWSGISCSMYYTTLLLPGVRPLYSVSCSM